MNACPRCGSSHIVTMPQRDAFLTPKPSVYECGGCGWRGLEKELKPLPSKDDQHRGPGVGERTR